MGCLQDDSTDVAFVLKELRFNRETTTNDEFVISSALGAVVSRTPDLDTVKNGDDRLLIGSDIY